MLTRTILAAAISWAAISPCLGQGAAPSLAAAALPETAPGRCAREFVAFLNDPTPAHAKAFEGAWASPRRLARTTPDERSERLIAMKARDGAYTLRRVLTADDNGIAALVDTSKRGTFIFDFEFDAVHPGRLDSISIMAERESRELTADERADVIAGVAGALRTGYVFPEIGETMAAAIEARCKEGGYDAFTIDAVLASRLTRDLQAISKDRHLRIAATPPSSAGDAPRSGPSRSEMRAENYGFKKVELLEPGVGYLRFDVFVDTAEARATAAAAMNFLAHCDTIIIDLRQNGGGSPKTIQFITSYLFDSKTHLNDMVDRKGKIVDEYWTLDEVPGARPGANARVYVLISPLTFSGAEEFSYNLQNLKRATIVGETSGGGAHPVRQEQVAEGVVMRVPFMRAQNPISMTNWEGTGVEPDVKVPAREALDKALELARTTRAAKD